MATILSVRQGLLTKAINRLVSTLNSYQDEINTPLDLPSEQTSRIEYITGRQNKIEQAKTTIEHDRNSLQTALDAYAIMADQLQQNTNTQAKEELQQTINMKVEQTLEHLDEAERYLSKLIELRKTLEVTDTKKLKDSNVYPPVMNLPPIPIPKFRGDIMEWETFWGAFNYNVHSRQMDDLQKMTYLLDALQGEAKECIKQYQISQGTYSIVIQHLKDKYDDKQALVHHLLRRLRTSEARTKRLEDQEKLCETLYSIVVQLQQKGECIDTLVLQQLLLEKFTKEIQRHARQKGRQRAEVTKTCELLKDIKDYIREELELRDLEQEKPTLRTEHVTRQQETFKTRRNACFYCNKAGHLPIGCDEIRTQQERIQVIKSRNLCYNCGSSLHQLPECKAGPCRNCNKHGHHTSICRYQHLPTECKPRKGGNTTTDGTHAPTKIPNTIPRDKKPSSSKINAVISDETRTEDTVVFYTKREHAPSSQILAGQTEVFNPDKAGQELTEVILDTGSDRSFITNALANRLQLRDSDSIELTIHTFGDQKPITRKCGVTTLKLKDAFGAEHNITVTRIDEITQPLERLNLSREDTDFIEDHKIKLSINPDLKSIHPQVLLGCSDSLTMLDSGLMQARILPSGLKLIPSKLGYLVTGTLHNRIDTANETASLMTDGTQVGQHRTAQQSWEKYWSFESSGIQEYAGPNVKERQEQNDYIWKEFQRTIEKREDGYYVRLPWKNDVSTLPDNRSIAAKRLQATIAKLRHDPIMFQNYHQTIKEQLDQNIIEEVDESIPTKGAVIHYLPHQAVLTPNKETTKLRIVYDASAHHRKAPSLNDVLHQGPPFLPQIYDILLRFRIGNVAMISDVEKAFLQIRLHEADRDATRFLWIRDISQPLEPRNIIVYRFTRVTFGLSCSPFLLAGTIRHHLNNCENDPKLVNHLISNTYVDNVILTTTSTQEAVSRYKEAKQIFNDLNMNLREFLSNDNDVLQQIPQKDRASKSVQKVLGIPWRSTEDKLFISCRCPTKLKLTERTIAEQVAAIYDPMGWLTPLTLKGKQFFQNLWNFDYTWDSPLSKDHKDQWEKIVNDFNGFETFIPRKVAQIGVASRLILFADASKHCMATCAYIVSNGESQLLAGKSKLPSVRDNPTIPKLELNALTLAARLAHSIYISLNNLTSITNITILSDSEVALSWIRPNEVQKTAGVLVKNRIKEIRRIVENLPTPVQFGYIATDQNAADCATRGLNKVELKNHMWWKGPAFIKELHAQNDQCLFTLLQGSMRKAQVSTATSIATTSVEELLDWKRFSRLARAKRTSTYILRFISKVSSKVRKELRDRICKIIPELHSMSTETYVTAIEQEAALRVLIRNHQAVHFSPRSMEEYKYLKLYHDEWGIIRCKGRLNKADLPREAQQPILISSKTALAKLIVTEAHLPFHNATGHTIAKTREKFWMKSIRQIAKKVIRQCVPCQKMNSLPYKYPPMDDLPERRVKRSRPFEHVGVDYFGPLAARNNEGTTKVYGIIITCATTRLLHLELVHNVTTNEFLLALRRFFARRGVPRTITSDNASNFLLSEQILQDAILPVVNDASLANTMATRGITWRTITPYAPWQGAFYERLIKSVKHSLYKILQRTVPTTEELETLLIEIEGNLNSRPLSYQEEGSDNFVILRPIDFIQRDIIITYPFEFSSEEEDKMYLPSHEAASLRTRREVQEALESSHKLTEQYWDIWSQEYLKSLRETHKLNINNKRGTPIAPTTGTVVLIHDPALPRNTWKMARIIDLKRSESGAIREAQLKLPTGRIIRRPINLLVPLELEDSPTQKQLDTKGEIESPTQDPQSAFEIPSQHYNLRPRSRDNNVPTNSRRTHSQQVEEEHEETTVQK